MDEDVLRSVALGSACVGLVTIPLLGPVFGGGEQSKRYDTVITPPDYAFAIWAPIFVGCVSNTVQQCSSKGRSLPASRRTGWPLAGAYATNALWSIAAQTNFALTPVLLPVAAGFAAVAHVRLQDARGVGAAEQLNLISTGLLLGWTALASTVNIAAGAQLLGVDKTSPRTVALSTAGLTAAAGLLAGVAAASSRGSTPVAAASGWGLFTIALASGKPRVVRLAAFVGGLMTTGAGAWRSAHLSNDTSRPH
jgi:hypothetical protein